MTKRKLFEDHEEMIESDQAKDNLQEKVVQFGKSLAKVFLIKAYKNAAAERFDDLSLLKSKLSELKESKAKSIYITLSEVEGEFKEADIEHTIYSIRQQIFLQAIKAVHQELQHSAGTTKKVADLNFDDLAYGDASEYFTHENRLKELYAIPEVKEVVDEELEKREHHLHIMEKGYELLPEILHLDADIQAAKDKMTYIRIQAMQNGNHDISPQEEEYINALKKKLGYLEEYKEHLLGHHEVSAVYRLETLKKRRKQFENEGFVMLPSREEIISEMMEDMLNGNSIMLIGATGTGKTVMAVKVSKEIQNYFFEDLLIDAKKLKEEVEYDPEIVEVLSGNSNITVGEIIAKIKLKAKQGGGTQTETQLGKILKAYAANKVPIIDEIDLIPTDILMRVKHLFTMDKGEVYKPQEGVGDDVLLQNTSMIVTGNMRSEKHPDREDLDAAVIRLFNAIEVPYFDSDEAYDLGLVFLMEKEGFINGISNSQLTGQRAVLPSLTEAMKEVEDNYMGKTPMEINGKQKQYLQKAILDTGNFAKMLKNYGLDDFSPASGENFVTYVKGKVLDFVTNRAYPKNDRLILITIFSLKGFITEDDRQYILKENNDLDADELQILSSSHQFTNDGIKFIDPYELSLIDPYNKRNIDQLPFESSFLNFSKNYFDISEALEYLDNVKKGTMLGLGKSGSEKLKEIMKTLAMASDSDSFTSTLASQQENINSALEGLIKQSKANRGGGEETTEIIINLVNTLKDIFEDERHQELLDNVNIIKTSKDAQEQVKVKEKKQEKEKGKTQTQNTSLEGMIVQKVVPKIKQSVEKSDFDSMFEFTKNLLELNGGAEKAREILRDLYKDMYEMKDWYREYESEVVMSSNPSEWMYRENTRNSYKLINLQTSVSPPFRMRRIIEEGHMQHMQINSGRSKTGIEDFPQKYKDKKCLFYKDSSGQHMLIIFDDTTSQLLKDLFETKKYDRQSFTTGLSDNIRA